jgi:hypothetical protein
MHLWPSDTVLQRDIHSLELSKYNVTRKAGETIQRQTEFLLKAWEFISNGLAQENVVHQRSANSRRKA